VHAKIKELKIKKNEKSTFQFGEKPDIDEYNSRVEREITKLNDKSYQDKWCFIEECFQVLNEDNNFKQDSEEEEEEEKKEENDDQAIEYKVRVSLLQLKKHHQLFLNLSFDSCKEIISNTPLIILEDSQLLYKEGDMISSAYIVITGLIVMHSKKLGAIGLVKIGDMIGEEWLINTYKGKERVESAYSSGLTFVLELTQENWDRLKNILYHLTAGKDIHKLMRIIENWHVKKKSWRQFRKKKQQSN
jgi:hypothetical protein